jgi:hypothetical protein
MNDSRGFICYRYPYFQHLAAAIASNEHQQVIQVDDPDRVPACVERVVFRNSMSPCAVSEVQLGEI